MTAEDKSQEARDAAVKLDAGWRQRFDAHISDSGVRNYVNFLQEFYLNRSLQAADAIPVGDDSSED